MTKNIFDYFLITMNRRWVFWEKIMFGFDANQNDNSIRLKNSEVVRESEGIEWFF